MNAPSERPDDDNPFATCFVRPGAIPFLFPPGVSAGQLVDRLRAAHWRGEIVGPHGSGKSTLLAALEQALSDAGKTMVKVTMREGMRRWPVGILRRRRSPRGTLLVVDGFEQLSRVQRWRGVIFCRLAGWGLLVTTHRPLGFSEIYHTHVDDALAQRIVRHLLASHDSTIAQSEVAARLSARQGNLREALFDLYDLFESRRSGR